MTALDPAGAKWDWPSFSRAELACRCGCGLLSFHPNFLDALQALRSEYRAFMPVTSACRCATHNVRVGGHPRSLHVGGSHKGQLGTLAVDVATPHAVVNYRLAELAMKRGWSVGVARWGLHLDRRDWVGMEPGLFGY